MDVHEIAHTLLPFCKVIVGEEQEAVRFDVVWVFETAA